MNVSAPSFFHKIENEGMWGNNLVMNEKEIHIFSLNIIWCSRLYGILVAA